jgi:hypothetical protein
MERRFVRVQLQFDQLGHLILLLAKVAVAIASNASNLSYRR